MLRNLATSSGGSRIFGTPYIGLPAAQIASETAGGDTGPGALHNEASEPANAGKRLRMVVGVWPVVGNLFVAENGAVLWSGLPDGVHSFGYEVFADDVSAGSATYTVSVGVPLVVDGAVLSGAGVFIPGEVSIGGGVSADGAVLTGAGVFVPGEAAVLPNPVADGAVLNGAGVFVPGSAVVGATGFALLLVVPGRRQLLRVRVREAGVMSFSPKRVGETVPRGFDLVRLLEAGETVAAVVFSVSVLRGVDAEAAAMVSGAATFAGSKVQQKIVGGVAGNYYEVQASVTTTAGHVYIERATLEVVA